MTRFSKSEYDLYMEQYREQQDKGNTQAERADPGPESKLQAKCEAWCKDHGFPFLSFRSSKGVKRMLPAGWPDLQVIQDHKVVFIG